MRSTSAQHGQDHLLRLFEKTGGERQAELIQLAASLAAPVAGI